MIGPELSTNDRNPYIERDNAASLLVYRRLKQAVADCQPCAGPYLNVAAVFFHDLMRILTGYALRIRECIGPYRPQTADEWQPLRRMPYLGFAEVENGIDLDTNTYGFGFTVPAVNLRRRWVSALARMAGPVLDRRATVAIVSPSALNPRQLVFDMLRSRMRVTFPMFTPLAIPNLNEQLTRLCQRIEEIGDDLSWPGPVDPVREVVNRHIRALATEGDPQPVTYQALICGTLSEPLTRLVAARTRAAGVPVVEVSHGEAEGVDDEPIFGYGDRSFVTELLGYGPGGGELLASAEHAESLHDPPAYIESDAPQVQRLNRGTEVRKLGGPKSHKVFYVPTTLSGNARYGPFRDMPDLMYIRWQEALLREFPELVYKGYPQGAVNDRLVPRGVRNSTRVPLHECVDEADVFVFDYLSSAFCIAAATSKPIIFFDIGLRNPSKAAKRAIAERCIYLRVDPENPGPLAERVREVAHEPRVNTFSEQFSLATRRQSRGREELAVDIVKRLLK